MVDHVNSIDRFVGGRVKFRRELLGISDEAAAAAVGVTLQRLSALEAGSLRFGAKDLQLLTKRFDVPVAYFFEGYVVRPRASDAQADDNDLIGVEAAE